LVSEVKPFVAPSVDVSALRVSGLSSWLARGYHAFVKPLRSNDA
jgi:hypothetical protein